VRVWLPGAARVDLLAPDGTPQGTLALRHPDGVFEGPTVSREYRLRAHWHDGSTSELDDAYRFAPVLGEMDVWLLAEGTT
jgi:1,4-alpha-glucan branching enzyme